MFMAANLKETSQSQISLLQSSIDKRSNNITRLEALLKNPEPEHSESYLDLCRGTLKGCREAQASQKRILGSILGKQKHNRHIDSLWDQHMRF